MPDMKYRHLGDSGPVVSVVGLGANNFGNRGRVDAEGTRKVIDAAQDVGVTLIDTSDSYGDSEELLGDALKGRRDEFVLATKFGSDLKGANGPDWGARTPLEETLEALGELVREGKVRYVGSSNLAGWQVAHAHWIAPDNVVWNQHGLGYNAHFPLDLIVVPTSDMP